MTTEFGEKTEITGKLDLTKAINNLDRYLKTPEELFLREHQFNAMAAIRNDWKNGEYDGYIWLPPSAGKTVIYSQLAFATGLRTLVLNPTLTTLDQANEEFEARAADVSVSNYYGNEKDLSGQVVITTYKSALDLVEQGKINPKDFGLLIPDELHAGLGEERHRLYRHFDHAPKIGLTATAFFDQINGYIRRGLVKPDEAWLKLFEHCIYEMSLEEAMERGISAQVDAHLIRTNTKVDSMEIASGDYNKGAIDRVLNVQTRNMMTIGLIAGLEALPASVQIANDKKQEIEQLHQNIKGEQTAVFGTSIEQIDMLAKVLREKGITAEAVHSKIDHDRRKDILKKHRTGEIQVVLGVDALRVGWDSPETKVGIYMAPTRSGVVALQELGRITRPYMDKRAKAIQFVDEFEIRGQAPILIPNLFDPDYVLRGSTSGNEIKKTGAHKRADPIITFSGLNIQTTIEEARSNQLLSDVFRRGSMDEISEIVDRLLDETTLKLPGASSLEIYREFAKAIPFFIPIEKQNDALRAVASIDTNIAQKGKKVLLHTGISTVFSALEPFITGKEEVDEVLFHAAMTGVMEGISNLKSGTYLRGRIYAFALEGILKSISEESGVPATWLRDNHSKEMIERARYLVNPNGLSSDNIRQVAHELADEYGVNQKQVENYLKMYDEQRTESEAPRDHVLNSAFTSQARESLDEAMSSLAPREREVLFQLFTLGKSRDALGRDFHVTRERIRQIEAKALRKLRNPSRSILIRDFSGSYDDRVLPMSFPDFSSKHWVNDEDIYTEVRVLAGQKVPREIYMESQRNGIKKIPWTEWLKIHPVVPDKIGYWDEGDALKEEYTRYEEYARSLPPGTPDAKTPPNIHPDWDRTVVKKQQLNTPAEPETNGSVQTESSEFTKNEIIESLVNQSRSGAFLDVEKLNKEVDELLQTHTFDGKLVSYNKVITIKREIFRYYINPVKNDGKKSISHLQIPVSDLQWLIDRTNDGSFGQLSIATIANMQFILNSNLSAFWYNFYFTGKHGERLVTAIAEFEKDREEPTVETQTDAQIPENVQPKPANITDEVLLRARKGTYVDPDILDSYAEELTTGMFNDTKISIIKTQKMVDELDNYISEIDEHGQDSVVHLPLSSTALSALSQLGKARPDLAIMTISGLKNILEAIENGSSDVAFTGGAKRIKELKMAIADFEKQIQQ